jgi:hypothetical protein
MRPAVAIMGFVLGSAAAITFALAGTAIVFTVLRSAHPHLDAELVPLVINLALFACLTATAGACFYAEVKERPWRRAALLALALSLAVVIVYQSLA